MLVPRFLIAIVTFVPLSFLLLPLLHIRSVAAPDPFDLNQAIHIIRDALNLFTGLHRDGLAAAPRPIRNFLLHVDRRHEIIAEGGRSAREARSIVRFLRLADERFARELPDLRSALEPANDLSSGLQLRTVAIHAAVARRETDPEGVYSALQDFYERWASEVVKIDGLYGAIDRARQLGIEGVAEQLEEIAGQKKDMVQLTHGTVVFFQQTYERQTGRRIQLPESLRTWEESWDRIQQRADGMEGGRDQEVGRAN